jgi:hypothetical protein
LPALAARATLTAALPWFLRAALSALVLLVTALLLPVSLSLILLPATLILSLTACWILVAVALILLRHRDLLGLIGQFMEQQIVCPTR